MDRLNLFLIGLTFLGLASCQNAEMKGQLKQTEELISTLDSIQSVYESIDWQLLDSASAVSQKNIEYIQQNLRDTISKEDAAKLTVYRRAGKSIRKSKSKVQEFEKELAYSMNQCENLYSDGSNGLMKVEDYTEKLKVESEAVTKLVEQTEQLSTWAQDKSEDFVRLNPYVDSLVHDLYLRGYR